MKRVTWDIDLPEAGRWPEVMQDREGFKEGQDKPFLFT